MASVLATSTPYKTQSAGAASNRPQDALKALLVWELKDVVFESNQIPTLFFPTQIAETYILPRNSKGLIPVWESLGVLDLEEEDYYLPLISLLNAITTHSKLLARVRFRAYNRRMGNSFDGAGRLKPDGVATDEAHENDKNVLWRDVWIAIEVKNRPSDGLRQALTYARSLLEVGNKWFSMVLHFRPAVTTLRMCFATRHGVFLTPEWHLNRTNDYIKAASCLLQACVALERNAMIDQYHLIHDQTGRVSFRLPVPGMGTFAYVRELHHRIHIVGRATHVYSAARTGDVRTLPDDTSEVALNKKLVDTLERHAPATDDNRRPTRTLRSDTKSAQSSQQTSQQPSQPAASSAIPAMSANSANAAVPANWESLCSNTSSAFFYPDVQQCVIKEAWVVYERFQVEAKVLDIVRGSYALPDIAGYTTVPHPGMERLAHFSKERLASESWRCGLWSEVYSGERTQPRFTPRVHVLIFYKTVGNDLASIIGNAMAVAYVIKDVIIALYILFVKGFLHRDISAGNILALPNVKTHTARQMAGYEWFNLENRFKPFADLIGEQYGFVCDFDQVVKWDEDRVHAAARSAALAFLSTSRLFAIITNDTSVDTLADDLEACIWTTLFVILKQHPEHDLSPIEKDHLAALSSDKAYEVLAAKQLILDLTANPKHRDTHTALRPTWPLWHRLFAAAKTARHETEMVIQRLNEKKVSPDEDELKRVSVDAVFLYLNAVKDAVADLKTSGV
ncbi:hypothetical protein EXIGLDRAFT_844363 [Exidia glandulosa HHB12029]|uniref:Fungal-type protein kinase domain-containing protein n=1 Tax=Exidia glandulosa HHB12029 TaxID=1314781 RepID=A0A165C3M7_EXIGL|nr:hypothetical protein EXIGLDRAFT_844363 [Exidia glandulosa HHB12029]